jgi:hypothetical protein
MTPRGGEAQPGWPAAAGQPFAVGPAAAARPASVDEFVSQLTAPVPTRMGEP